MKIFILEDAQAARLVDRLGDLTGEYGLYRTLFDQHQGNYPEGWNVSVDEEGGQPNGRGEIESSDAREWFRAEYESHRRTKIGVEGPWIEGSRDWVKEYLRKQQEAADAQRRRDEDRVLEQAERIRAARAAEQS